MAAHKNSHKKYIRDLKFNLKLSIIKLVVSTDDC
mgnify:CR=1 FL=1|jgi:hypothetical protein